MGDKKRIGTGNTSLKITMAVAVSWGLFVGATITSHASDDVADIQGSSAQINEEQGQESQELVSQEESEQPVESAEGEQLTEQEESGQPAEPVEGEQQAEQEEPVQAEESALGEQQAAQEESEQPAEPVEGEQQADQEESVQPAESAEDEQQADQEESEQPEESVEGEQQAAQDEEQQDDEQTDAQYSTLMVLSDVQSPDQQIQQVDLTNATQQQFQKVDLTDTADKQEETRTVKIAIISDPHYLDPAQKTVPRSTAIDKASSEELRLVEEVDVILDTALSQVEAEDPDVLLVCGDMTSNGEYSNAQAIASRLKDVKNAEGMDDVGIYVVNGNHDINNSYAVDLSKDVREAAKRISPDDFKEIYDGLGYGEEDYCEGGSRDAFTPKSDDPSKVENHGGLSYATDIADGVRLIVMDTGIYSYKDLENTMYSEAQKTAGDINKELLKWAVKEAKTAKEDGKLVLAMCHHSIMPHQTKLNETMDEYNTQYIVPNYKEVSTALADAGVTAVLTGHTHANDIAKFVSEKGNVIYDIQTASLGAYPTAWRTINIDITGSGADSAYDFSVDTHFLDKDFKDADTSEWKIQVGKDKKDFKEDYAGSMQTYGYDKTSIREDAADDIVEYLTRDILYDVSSNKDGLDGYLRDKLEIKTEPDLGTYVLNQASNALGEFKELERSFDVDGRTIKLKLKQNEESTKTVLKYDVKLSYLFFSNTATVTVDLSGVRSGVNTIISSLNDAIKVGDWKDGKYVPSAMHGEVTRLASEVLTNALKKPIDEKDPQSPTGFAVVSDAMQAYAKGDEGVEQTADRKKWNELLRGESFAKNITTAIWDSVAAIDKTRYPIIGNALETKLSPVGRKLVKVDGSGMMINQVKDTIESLESAKTALEVAKGTLKTNPIPVSVGNTVGNMLANMQEGLTQDTNIPEDSNWKFNTILFYPDNGTKTVYRTSTIEDGKAGKLPKVTREDYEFTGWYTVKGELVTADTNLRGIYKLYAKWNYVGHDEDDEAGDDYDDIIVDNNTDDTDDGWYDNYILDDEDGLKVSDYMAYAEDMYEDMDFIYRNLVFADEFGFDSYAENANGIRILDASVYDDKLVDENGNEITDDIFVSPLRRVVINFKHWKYMNPTLVKALDESKLDIEIYYINDGKLCKFMIPKGTDLSKYADKSGFLGIQYLESIILNSGAKPVQV